MTTKHARYRLRQAGLLPPRPLCPCGRQIRGDRALCSRCWLRTDEGRAWQRERVKAYRERRRR